MLFKITSNPNIPLMLNDDFSFFLKAEGGKKPYRWQAEKFYFGIELKPTGELKGKPQFSYLSEGDFLNIKLSVFDAVGRKATQEFKFYFYAPTTLWMCGLNDKGQLGDGTTINRSSPVQTFVGGTNWWKVSIRNSATAAIKTDGTLWTWGNNEYGQLLTGNFTNRSIPAPASYGDKRWIQVAIGGKHAAGITNKSSDPYRKPDFAINGSSIVIWGDNSFGQHGNNSTSPSNITVIPSPSLSVYWTEIACGENHILALRSDRTLWAWGDNQYGQLGDGTTISRSSPVQVLGEQLDGWRALFPKLDNHSFALAFGFALKTWGNNNKGQLGDGTTSNRSLPVAPSYESGVWYSPAATENNGTLAKIFTNDINKRGIIGFGDNCNAEFGNNEIDCAGSPTPEITVWQYQTNNAVPLMYADLYPEYVFAGQSVACMRRTYYPFYGSRILTWGLNTYGQLGDNTTVNRSSPVQTIMGGSSWRTCAMGGHTFAAIKYGY